MALDCTLAIAQGEAYVIRHFPLGMAIIGSIPCDDFAALAALAKKRGYGFIFPGIGDAIGADFVFSSKKNGKAWLKELAKSGDWLKSGDTGTSSRTIYYTFTGQGHRDGVGSIPVDPDDFGRCYRLLKLHPDWIPRLGEVAAKYPEWEPLVANWAEMTLLYERDVATGRCQELYALMQQLRAARPAPAPAGK